MYERLVQIVRQSLILSMTAVWFNARRRRRPSKKVNFPEYFFGGSFRKSGEREINSRIKYAKNWWFLLIIITEWRQTTFYIDSKLQNYIS